MSTELGYAEAHDTSIEDRYTPAPLLKGKVIVVSGIGPGLGRSLAVEAAKMGADLVLASRTEARLDEVAKEVAEYGVRAVTVVTDVTDEERNIAAEQAAHFAAVQAAEMVTPRRIRESIELDARAPDMDRAMLLIDAGRLGAARNVWKRALERAPDSAPLHYNIAAVSEAMGEVDVAREHYSAAVRLAPKERWYRLERKMFERRTSGAR